MREQSRMAGSRSNAIAMVVVTAALGIALAGCAQSPYITVPSSASFTPVPDRASIIIVQPTTRLQINILDGQGELVGQVNDRSRTVVRVPPGPVRLYAIPGAVAEAGDRIEGHVQAGRTYYATISVRGGGFGGVAFRALNPRSLDDRWAQRDSYMAKTPLIEMDAAKVAVAIRSIGETAPLLQKIDAKIEKLSPAYRDERTIDPADGL